MEGYYRNGDISNMFITIMKRGVQMRNVQINLLPLTQKVTDLK